jgi:hypothetical protein
MQHYLFPDGTVVSENGSHVINGQKWGGGDFTDRWDELHALGVKPYRVETDVPAGYQATGWETVEIDGEMVRRPTGTEPAQTVSELRAKLISEVKSAAYGKLLPTDWYVVRNAEIAEPVPQEISLQRASIRSAADTAEADLNALADYDQLLAYQPAWPEE